MSTVTLGLRAGDDEVSLTMPASVASEVRATFADQLAEVGRAAAQVTVIEAADRWAITVDGRLWVPGPDQSLVDQLVYVLLRVSLDAHPDRLHLHGSVVSWNGAGLLLAGYPGSGKSTLTAHLVEAGFDYATDERLALGPDLVAVPFTRPISLSANSFHLFPHLDPARTGAGSASATLWHVPASQVRQGCVRTDAPVRAIAFVQYRPIAGASVEAMHPAEAVRLLLSDSPDAVRLGAAAVPLAARWCAGLRCVRLEFGDERAAAERLADLAALPAVVADDVTVLSATPSPLAGAPAPAPGVSGVAIGDRCVLFRARDGEVVELDESLSAWFRLFDGSTPLDQLVAEVAEANGLSVAEVTALAATMLERLRDTGVVA
jgi:hypothetical protein